MEGGELVQHLYIESLPVRGAKCPGRCRVLAKQRAVRTLGRTRHAAASAFSA